MSATETATDAATHVYEVARGRLGDVDWPAVDWPDVAWPDVAWPDVALDDVLEDVSVTVRRHPRAALAIIALTVVATCGVIWFARRRRTDRAVEETEFALAGVA
jgi:hypothetical protein